MGDGHDSNDGLQYNTVLCRVYCYFYFNCLVMLLWQFFFVSNPYHVVLNRQSSGERGAQLDQTDTIESEAVTTPRVTEAEIKRETETT